MTHETLVDVFFTITGVAVVLVTIFLAIGLIYLISIFRTIRRIVRTAEFASEVIREDVMELRDNIKEKGLSLSSFTGFMSKMAKHRIFPKTKK